MIRTKLNLLLKHVDPKLDTDTSIICKMERSKRSIKKEQIAILADIFKANKEELHTLWNADKVMDAIKVETFANEAFKLVTKK